jgi:hypothetical protein
MTDEWPAEKSVSGRVRNSAGQTGMPAEREVKASRRRKGVKAKPNTCSTSPRSIRAARRRAEALDLLVQGYTFELIGKHLGVSKAQAARDIDTALAEITVEPARELLKLELRRCEELMAAHYANACDGDVTATNTVSRVMAHRAMLMGWSRDQHGVARLVISDGGGAGGEPRPAECGTTATNLIEGIVVAKNPNRSLRVRRFACLSPVTITTRRRATDWSTPKAGWLLRVERPRPVIIEFGLTGGFIMGSQFRRRACAACGYATISKP